MSETGRTHATALLLLLVISAAMLFYRLGSLPLTGADEPRYARIAQEMSAGHRWVTPVLEGLPWLEKPPLYYWMTIPVVRVAGGTEAAARLGPALSALLAVLAMFWLGGRLWGPLEGFLGAAILLTSIGFVAFGRSASTDMPMTACLTVSLAVLLACSVGQLPRILLAAGYGFLGLSILAKGPVSLVLFGAIAVLFWCCEPQVTLRRWHAAEGALLAGAVALPWFWLAFRENGFSFIAVFFVNHNLARYVSDLHHHTQPFYFYLPVLMGMLFPWTGWLVLLFEPGWWRALRRLPGKDPARFFLMLWAVVPLLFFSMSRSKLPGYILPVLPPIALLLGGRVAAVLRSRTASAAAAWASGVFGMSLAVALPFVFGKSYGNWPVGAMIGAVAAAGALVVFLFLRSGAWRSAWTSTVVQSVALVAALALIGFPAIGPYHSAKGIALQALSARAGNEPIVSYKYFHHTLHYYTNYQVAADLPDAEALKRFAESHQDFLVVTEARRLDELRALNASSASLLGAQARLCLVRIGPAARP